MSGGNPYNGFSWADRLRKFQEMNRRLASRELEQPSGPCALCGDPDSPVEYHDEDYSIPYRWEPPAVYVLCHHCHVHKLHTRFLRPTRWLAFLAHVRRGGYARDLKDPLIKKEFEAYCKTIENGQRCALRSLRPYVAKQGQEWFADLRLDNAVR